MQIAHFFERAHYGGIDFKRLFVPPDQPYSTFVRDSDWPLPSESPSAFDSPDPMGVGAKTIFALAFGANRAAASTTISQRNADKGIMNSSTF